MKFQNREKKFLPGIWILAYISGSTLFILAHWVRITSVIGEQHHPIEYWIRVVHTTITYCVVITIGYLLKGHVLPGLRSKKKRRARSGIGILMIFFILAGSAIGTLYSGDSVWNNYMTQIHSIIGLCSPLALLIHLFLKYQK